MFVDHVGAIAFVTFRCHMNRLFTSTLGLGLLPIKQTLVGATDTRSPKGEDTDEAREDRSSSCLYGIGAEFGHSTDVVVTGASRTDAGVHARRQVFHVDIPQAETCLVGGRSCALSDLVARTNAHLNDGIIVHSLARLKHPRFDCSRASIGKRYTYSMFDLDKSLSMLELSEKEQSRVLDLYNDSMRVHCREKLLRLNVEEMHRASQAFIGTHDFRRFTRSAKRCAKQVDSKERTIRTVYSAAVWRDRDGVVRFQVEGNGFLYLMVRCMASALMDVGRGKLSVADVEAALRMPQGSTGECMNVFVPLQPNGLCLDQVYYETAAFVDAATPAWAGSVRGGDEET